MNNKIIKSILFVPILFSSMSCASGGGKDKKPEVVDNKIVTPILTLEGNKLSWNYNSCANYYAIFINDTFKAREDGTFYYLEDRINGEFNIKIRAYDKFLRYEESDFSNVVHYVVNVNELLAPVVSVDRDYLIWNDVANADEYRVYCDTQWKNNWIIKNENGVNKCQMQYSSNGVYSIVVKAFSNNLTYEKEKASEKISYYITTDKIWYPKTIYRDLEKFGDVKLSNNLIKLNSNLTGVKSGFMSNLVIAATHSYFYLSFNSVEEANPNNIELKVDGEIINAIDSSLKSPRIPDDTLVYDLTKFVGLASKLSVSNKNNVSLTIKSARLFTDNNVSQLNKWNPTEIYNDWYAEGDFELHGEGFCLEKTGSVVPSCTNTIDLTGISQLSLLLRKFQRLGTKQDTDPQLYLYVDNVLVRPIGSSVDYATATGDAYESYGYDLSSWSNQIVTIKLLSQAGEHACLGEVKVL